jgi:hypothetical protein
MRLLALSLLTACSSGAKYSDDASDTSRYGNDDSSSDSADGTDEDAPALWSIDGWFVIAEGAPDPTKSSLDIVVLDEDMQAVCDPKPVSFGPVVVLPAPDPAIYTWWEITVPVIGGGCTAMLPPTFRIGIGAFDERLTPYLLGLDGVSETASTSLNGAYASVDGDENVWIYGIAGPTEAFEGTGDPVRTAEAVVGSWKIETVFHLPLP